MMPNKSAKILVVDDDTRSLQVVVNHFSDTNYELIHAPNGELGCQVAFDELPDLILMDWAMPLMNGIDAILWLKAKAETKGIPIVMTTGVMTESKDLKEALEAGAVDFIRKPYDPLELTARVDAVLRLSESYRDIQRKNQEIETLLSREKELMGREIAHKERELSMQAVNIYEKNEFLRGLISNISNVVKSIEEAPDKFKGVIKEIEEHIDLENSWEKFMLHFEQVHPDFFSKVHERFANLTVNELRMLAYLKIGMGNKEIARLTGVEPASVKTFIYRLKKKMNLSADDNLREMMMHL